ncbi:M48 family metalloprotease [Sphingomonas prati]|uniref:Zn-dependent protease with chaperone function n=1 Tax=Sphingomonas prati TaxID=1843237 RepID=A0A7W9BT56_9SPHN|nr:M48 family metalloprotease [Sphingomonas prati]MBB5729667.1 Zn-dependent protease with chaperone function [Sphingomonas prati]
MLVASVLWFAAQFWWHLETVKRAIGFHFVDAADEPRLCRVIEPLLILTGLPVPFVGVIEDPARNAFACGIGRKRAVVVVTRGLLDALDDHELAGVLAHELSHIRHGDIRLMAAANIFMSVLTKLHARNGLRFTWVHAMLSWAIPAILPLSLVGGIVARWALKAGQVSRLLIASSREFIADAEAARWTQNPAALASALLKVDGLHRVSGARAQDDAMMIAGDTEGAGATHPTVTQRIAALARTTGSMVFNAPSAPRPEDWTAATTPESLKRVSFGQGALAGQAVASVRRGDDEDVLGLDLFGRCALIAALIGLGLLHFAELDQPRAIAAKFSLRPIATLVGSPIACLLGPFSTRAKERCSAGDTSRGYQAFEGQRHTLAGLLADTSRTRREFGITGSDVTMTSLMRGQLAKSYHGGSGRLRPIKTLRNRDDDTFIDTKGGAALGVPDQIVIAEYEQIGCFPIIGAPEGRAALPLDGVTRGGMSLRTLAAAADRDARLALIEVPTSGSVAAVRYARGRQIRLSAAFQEFGAPGMAAMSRHFTSSMHVAAVASLAAVADLRVLNPVDRASVAALVRSPATYVPCASLADR